MNRRAAPAFSAGGTRLYIAVAPPDEKDSAILMNLAPGQYTAIVRDATSGTGIALFEAYNLRLPPPLAFH